MKERLTISEEEQEMELFNSISGIVKLKEERPNIDTKGILSLILTEMNKYNHKGQVIQVEQANPVIIDQDKIEDINDNDNNDLSLGKPDKPFIKVKNRNAKPSMKTLADPRMNTHAEHKHEHSKYEGNPWGVPINIWNVCSKCGKLGVTGFAVCPQGDKTYVYKSFEHHMPGDTHKQSCYETLERFEGKHRYEELIKMKSRK